MNESNSAGSDGRRTRLRDQVAQIIDEQRELRAQIQALTDLVQSTVVGELRVVDRHLDEGVRDLAARSATFETATGEALTALSSTTAALDEAAARATLLAKSARDATPAAAERLAAARAESGYDKPWTTKDPLVSVRIATYQRTHELMTISLPSVLAQTHGNLEIVIVNDGPNPETAEAIRELGDPRVTYVEFPHRSIYPERRAHRWFVAGSPGMNEGIRRSTGLWVAPLDEDDVFEPDHIERLLAVAKDSRAEVAYGALTQRNLVDGSEAHIFSYPPERGGFSFQGALVHRSLRFFEYDQESWLVDEPGDWNLARRMLAAGVRFAGVDEVVGVLNWTPYTHKSTDEADAG